MYKKYNMQQLNLPLFTDILFEENDIVFFVNDIVESILIISLMTLIQNSVPRRITPK